MSDVYVPAPPPPPPPQPQAGYDFLRPFVFLFDDPRWLNKTLMGGLFILLSLFLVGVPFVLGYLAKTIRNVVAGVVHPLPEWDELGEYFNEGLVLFGVSLIYTLPIAVLSVGANIGIGFTRTVGAIGARTASCEFATKAIISVSGPRGLTR